jgi:hypothetical protein
VVIGIDCTGSCKSNYRTTTTAPRYDEITTAKNLWDQLLCSELTGVQIIQIKLRKISCTEIFFFFFKVWFIQDSILFSSFGSDRCQCICKLFCPLNTIYKIGLELVLNATFINIEKSRKRPQTCHKLLTNLYHIK